MESSGSQNISMNNSNFINGDSKNWNFEIHFTKLYKQHMECPEKSIEDMV